MPADLRDVFRPSRCPYCQDGKLRYRDDRGIAECERCSSLWFTETKPGTDYRSLTYHMTFDEHPRREAQTGDSNE